MVQSLVQPIAQKVSDFFADDDERDSIVLKSGITVWVRQVLSAEQQARFQRVLMTLELDMATREMKLKDVSWERQQILLAQAYILDWEGVLDKQGNPVPYNKDLVLQMRPAVLEEICRGIDEMQKGREAEAEKKGE